MTDRNLMQQALNALKTCEYRPNESGGEYLHYDEDEVDEAVTALTKRLAQPEQEPVAWENLLGAIARGWGHPQNARKTMDVELAVAIAKEIQDMYTTPPAAQRTWVGLRAEEFHDLQIENIDDPWANFKAIEAKLKEKNT